MIFHNYAATVHNYQSKSQKKISRTKKALALQHFLARNPKSCSAAPFCWTFPWNLQATSRMDATAAARPKFINCRCFMPRGGASESRVRRYQENRKIYKCRTKFHKFDRCWSNKSQMCHPFWVLQPSNLSGQEAWAILRISFTKISTSLTTYQSSPFVTMDANM